MADEPKTAADGTPVIEEKVEFTPEQQTKVNELIQKAMGKAAKDLRAEVTANKDEITRLTNELAEARKAQSKAKTPGEKNEASDEIVSLTNQIEEMKARAKTTNDELERFKKEAATKARETEAAKAETQAVRKDVALQSAASQFNFVNLEVVRQLTKDNVVWSDDYKTWVVLNETGQPRLDATLEKPLSLTGFFGEFAQKNPYLVRSDVKSGSGGTESTRKSLTGNGKVELTQIFGPKSNSKLANELALQDPQEYKRLKALAIQAGLIH